MFFECVAVNDIIVIESLQEIFQPCKTELQA